LPCHCHCQDCTVDDACLYYEEYTTPLVSSWPICKRLTVGGGLEGAEPLAETSCSEEPMSPTDIPATLLHSLASPPSFGKEKITAVSKARPRQRQQQYSSTSHHHDHGTHRTRRRKVVVMLKSILGM